MKKVIIDSSVLLLFLFVGLSSVYAGFEEGLAAYNRGDYETAFQEFKPLAEQGHAGAQLNLSTMYHIGKGVPQDYVEAFKWNKKAAEQGDAKAQAGLGVMYYGGLGVRKDYVMAYMWFNLAAAQGWEGAAKSRSRVEKKMPSEQIAEAQRLSREFKVKKP